MSAIEEVRAPEMRVR